MPFDKLTVQDSFVYAKGYKDTIQDVDGNDIPNPETKKQAAQRFIDEYVAEVVAGYEVSKHVETERLIKLDEVKQAGIVQGDVIK